jgi:hypothetical protein
MEHIQNFWITYGNGTEVDLTSSRNKTVKIVTYGPFELQAPDKFLIGSEWNKWEPHMR